jgi:hypothetical protein
MAITTEAPKYGTELLNATEKALKAHDLRLRPGQTLETVLDGLAQEQVVIGESHGFAQAEMSGKPVHLSTVLESFAEKQSARFFPRNVDNVQSRDAMDRQGKVEYIGKHGLAAYTALPQTVSKDQPVVLSPDRLTAKQWKSLDLQTRAELSGQWGPEAIGRIVSRR